MLKVSTFSAETEYGPSVIPLFGPADAYFEKTAAPSLLPDVVSYIQTLRPRPDAQYVLVNAMGAAEYFGSNINGDAFTEASLIHRPDEWTGNPLVDRIKAKNWPYGFPTFYGAHPYAHHRNKDATRAFGEVELAVWHPAMKRVELVTRVDREKCYAFGGVQVWDKLLAAMFPDVSMGTKVPFDTCSICLDWDKYRKAQATFDPKKHKHPGEAVLEVYRSTQKKIKNAEGKDEWVGQGAIRGVSVTRKDYCIHAKTQMNRILPDGRKVWVWNDYPRFFDISFVFIGADRTAKTMMKIAASGRTMVYVSTGLPVTLIGSAEQAEKLGYVESEEVLSPVFMAEKMAAAKLARDKEGEITKDVMPSQFAGKAVPVLTKHEEDLPEEVLNAMRFLPSSDALSTATGMGIILRPREFEHVTQGDEGKSLDLSPSRFHDGLARMLIPLLLGRSMLGPYIERRVIVVVGKPASETSEKTKGSSSLSSLPLRKMSSAYSEYRHGVMELVPHSQDLIGGIAGRNIDLTKLAVADANSIFTPLSVAYIQDAFLDELPGGSPKIAQAKAIVERGAPSMNTLSAFTGRSSR
jgi:hypothetical protein